MTLPGDPQINRKVLIANHDSCAKVPDERFPAGFPHQEEKMPRGQPISLDAISEHESFRDGSRSNFLTTAVGNTIVERGHTVASLRRIVLRNCLLSRTAKRPARARAVWRFLVATSRHILAMYPIRIHLRSALRVSFSISFLVFSFYSISPFIFPALLPSPSTQVGVSYVLYAWCSQVPATGCNAR